MPVRPRSPRWLLAAFVAGSVALGAACGGDDDGPDPEADAVVSLCASRSGAAVALDELGPALDAGDPVAIEAALRQAQAALRGATTVELALLDAALPAAVATFAATFDDLVEQAAAVGFAADAVVDLVNALGADPASDFTAADATISSVAAERCGGDADTTVPASTTTTVAVEPAAALVAGILGSTPYAGTDSERCIVDALDAAFTDEQLATLDQTDVQAAEAATLGSAFEGCLPYRSVLADGLARELDPAQVDCVLGALGEVTWATVFGGATAAQAALDDAITGCVPAVATTGG